MAQGGARAGAGRKPKPKIELSATKGIASTVLASIDEVALWRALLRADLPVGQIHTLELGEQRLIKETAEYLTNRRDGKPAQGVFVGDTRESERPLDRGDIPSLISAKAENPGGTGKPN